MVKNLPANAGDMSLIHVLGRSPGEGNGNPLLYSCLENSMDREAWWATICGGAKESDTTWWLNNSKFRQILICLGLSCLLWKNEGMSPLQPWKWLTKIVSIRLECNAILIGLEMGLVLSYISNIIIWSHKLNSLRFKYVVCDLGAISQNLLSALIPSTVSPSNMEN